LAFADLYLPPFAYSHLSGGVLAEQYSRADGLDRGGGEYKKWESLKIGKAGRQSYLACSSRHQGAGPSQDHGIGEK
jgi:hypothetical protein